MIKKVLKSIFSSLGYSLTKKPANVPTQFRAHGFDYAPIKPIASYAPWISDKTFSDVYTHIQKDTLVDIYRCYELWEIAEAIHRLDNDAAFIEIGVWRGGTAAIAGYKLKTLNAQVNFYIADTFTGVVKATKKDSYYKGGEHSDTSLEYVESVLKDKYDHYKILQGIFPEETSHLILPGKKFGYCHIDVDVYQSVKDIVEWIWDKMIDGGVIVFDDYGFYGCNGVTQYVNEQKKLTDRFIIHNLNGHAVMIKIKK
jgi:O-methyltransferase